MTTDLKTFILELAARKPNMRAHRLAQEVRTWDMHRALQAYEDYADRREQEKARFTPQAKGWLQRFAELF